jgi:NADPH:quinone reductase-like Zn-dependent oxidoreductase
MDGTMTETMLAVRQLAWESRPELVTVPVPTPGPGEVLIRFGRRVSAIPTYT